MPATGTPPHKLAGFTTSPHYNEQILDLTLDPDVIVHINAPPADAFDPKLPVRLVIFALPNGNTIDQTVGRQMTEGLDWHYDIQHIGAQTRVLRKTMTDCNIVVAYLQAAKRSWPHWRRSHDDANARIATIVQELRSRFQDMNCTVELTAHSGGGSFLFGFIESSEPIPEWVTRFIWLDANYGFEEETHGKKLAKWLQANPKNRLGAYAYDDRDVKFKGKPIVSKTGGTYRRTEDMKSFFGETFQLKKAKRDAFIRYRSPSNQLELILLRNPDKKILHTVMVERNGFIHAIALGTPWEEKVAPFWSERAYTEFVQPN
ncbi:MAG: hypothetical protein DHS20C16_33650 [Phycisphaerae bacterium]|nr:MAG: hypothetical protein DHS20C16_33650 [Phycisphaerae bacterium]